MDVNEELKFLGKFKKKIYFFFWGGGGLVRVDVNKNLKFLKIQKKNWGGGGGGSQGGCE